VFKIRCGSRYHDLHTECYRFPRIVGRVGKPLNIVHPIKDGALSGMEAAPELLKFAFEDSADDGG
jgi:actin-like ATPase involved in cell morphogenesis